jgi:isopenicillin N synthase-like dioxygenase
MREVLECTREFFSAPVAVKEEISIRLRPRGGRGYQRIFDNVTYGSVDLHEGVDFLRDYDAPPPWMALLAAAPESHRAIAMSKNMWPHVPQRFPALLQAYVEDMKRVGRGLMRVCPYVCGCRRVGVGVFGVSVYRGCVGASVRVRVCLCAVVCACA